MQQADALALDGVGLDYPGRPGVLRGIQLRLPARSILVVQGRSGSGKSSLLGVCAGLQRPTTGTVRVLGEAMADDAQRAGLRSRHIGLVLQHLHLLGELSLVDNVALPLRLAGRPRREQLERSRTLLRSFGLGDVQDKKPPQCSGGEQQRAAIARAMAMKPGLLLVDEPTSALDTANAKAVMEALRTVCDEGAAVLVATHDDLLRGLGRTIRLVDGRIQGGP